MSFGVICHHILTLLTSKLKPPPSTHHTKHNVFTRSVFSSLLVSAGERGKGNNAGIATARGDDFDGVVFHDVAMNCTSQHEVIQSKRLQKLSNEEASENLIVVGSDQEDNKNETRKILKFTKHNFDLNRDYGHYSNNIKNTSVNYKENFRKFHEPKTKSFKPLKMSLAETKV